MKINHLKLLFVVLLAFNCGSDDNANTTPQSLPGDTNTEFVIGTDAYVATNAYLLLDDATLDNEYDRTFTFVFSDQDIVEDSANEIAYNTSTTHFTKFTCQLIATVTNEADIPLFTWTNTLPVNILAEGNHYSSTGISSFNNTIMVSGNNYGQPDVVTNSYNHSALGIGSTAHDTPNHLLEINAFTYDLTARTGTIDCTYTYRDDNGVLVEGVYVGNYNILTAF